MKLIESNKPGKMDNTIKAKEQTVHKTLNNVGNEKETGDLMNMPGMDQQPMGPAATNPSHLTTANKKAMFIYFFPVNNIKGGFLCTRK